MGLNVVSNKLNSRIGEVSYTKYGTKQFNVKEIKIIDKWRRKHCKTKSSKKIQTKLVTLLYGATFSGKTTLDYS